MERPLEIRLRREIPRSSVLATSVVCCAVLLLVACRAAPEREFAAELAGAQGEENWVRIHRLAEATSGINLDLFARRTPTLFDNSGGVLHSWPEARVKSRVRLLPDGSLLGLGLGPAVFEYGWDGTESWSFRFEDELPHHDLIRLRNGNTLVITRRDGAVTDDLVEIAHTAEGELNTSGSASGKAAQEAAEGTAEIVWRWRSADPLAALVDETTQPDLDDLTHFNSVQELPENPLAAAGDERFRPGNLLVSARNLNAIFVVDRPSGEVVWSWSEGLDMQHEALMIGAGHTAAGDASSAGAERSQGSFSPGTILVLDNGTRGRERDRQSAVLAIEPSTGEVVWQYTSPTFFTPTGGVQQPLPSGNVLVTSTRGGRTFEVTPAGEIVWEWVPPWDPTRTVRYPFDHAPQLAALRRPQREITPPEGYRFVERRVYRVAHRRDIRRAKMAGKTRRLLREPTHCREVLLPMEPRIQLGYALVREVSAGEAAQRSSAVFRLTAKEVGEPDSSGESGGRARELFSRTLVAPREADQWFTATVDLSRAGLRHMELCLEADAGPLEENAGGPASDALGVRPVWGVPAILSPYDPPDWSETGEAEDEAADGSDSAGLTEEELEARRKHLRTMGYID